MLLAVKLTRLVRDYRRHVPGSRLKGRTVAIFSALAVAPILVVYYFSLQFLNRGIDSSRVSFRPWLTSSSNQLSMPRFKNCSEK